MRRYLEVWRQPGARLLIAFGFLGRLPMSMLPLALLLVVEHRTGSYASAGIATGVYTVSLAAASPVLGRLVDRLGPRPVLLATGIAYPAALLTLLGVLTLPAPLPVVYVAAAAAGGLYPVLSSTIRAIWSQVAAGDAALRQTAYALDSVGVEIVWVTGPLLVGVLTAVASPAAALALAAALSVTGTLTVALSGPVRRWRHRTDAEAGAASPLRAPGMAALLGGVGALMFAFGIIEVAVPAHADRTGTAAAAGALLATWSLGSAAGGIWFGTRRVVRPLAEQWGWGLLLVAASLVPLVFASRWWIVPLLFLFGTAIAPTLIVMNGLVAEKAPPGTTTEAFTWVTTVAFASSSGGTAVGGLLVELPSGVPGAFTAAVGCATLAWLTAVAGRLPRPPYGARMTSTVQSATGVRRYAALWRIPGAPVLVVAGLIARLPIGMGPLAIVLLVEQATGAYAYAGAASAAYALATAAGGPVLGRLADRHGPSRVLVGSGLAYPLGVAAVLGTVHGHAPFWAVLLGCALLGGTMPPLTAALRGVWADLTSGDRRHLNILALAAETTLFEVVFVAGPVIVGAIVALASPSAALVVAAVVTVAGTAAVAFGRATRGVRPHPDAVRTRGLGPLAAPGLPMTLSITAGVTFAFGVVGVAVPAFAGQHPGAHDVGTVAGVLLGLWGIGSVTGGIWFGTRTFRAPLPSQWAVTLLLAGLGTGMLALAPSVQWLAVGLLVGGCALAPALTVENGLVGRLAPVRMINEAYTWLVTVAVASGAAGSAAAGVIVDRPGGVAWAFALAATTTIAGAMASAWPRSPLRAAVR